MIHVATEQGLIPAVDYLDLLGVSATQPVHFEGEKPTWAQKFHVPSTGSKRKSVGEPEGDGMPRAKRPSTGLAMKKVEVVTTTEPSSGLEITRKSLPAATKSTWAPTGALAHPPDKCIKWPPEDEVDWSDSELN